MRRPRMMSSLPTPPQPMQSFYRNKCEFTIGPSPDGKGASLVYHCQMSGSLCTKTCVCVCVFVLCHVLTLLPQITHWDSELDHTEVSCWLSAACCIQEPFCLCSLSLTLRLTLTSPHNTITSPHTPSHHLTPPRIPVTHTIASPHNPITSPHPSIAFTCAAADLSVVPPYSCLNVPEKMKEIVRVSLYQSL